LHGQFLILKDYISGECRKPSKDLVVLEMSKHTGYTSRTVYFSNEKAEGVSSTEKA